MQTMVHQNRKRKYANGRVKKNGTGQIVTQWKSTKCALHLLIAFEWRKVERYQLWPARKGSSLVGGDVVAHWNTAPPALVWSRI